MVMDLWQFEPGPEHRLVHLIRRQALYNLHREPRCAVDVGSSGNIVVIRCRCISSVAPDSSALGNSDSNKVGTLKRVDLACKDFFVQAPQVMKVDIFVF
jgi:hypothetical protein